MFSCVFLCFLVFSCVFLCFLVFSCVFSCFLVVDDTEINYGHVMWMVKVWRKRERQAVSVRLRDCHLCRLNEHFGTGTRAPCEYIG